MKDPVDLPPKRPRHFVCVNLITGHIRNEKTMTPGQAVRINSLNHMIGSGYKWLWNNQTDFNDKLLDDTDHFAVR